MRKRKWTRIEVYETEIIRLREAGLTRQEIADELGLDKIQIKNWINRYNKRQSASQAENDALNRYWKIHRKSHLLGLTGGTNNQGCCRITAIAEYPRR